MISALDNFLRLICLSVLGFISVTCAAEPMDILRELRETPISRFEWGLEKFRQGLVEHFRIDPLSLEPSMPPFFVNVIFSEENAEILVEIGRTFGSSEETRARQFCEDYLIRVRSHLAIDRIGNPVSKGVSTLAADYFQSPHLSVEQNLEVAKALDSIVVLRGLVVAPASGIYAVCGAKLVDMPIRHLESP